MLYQQSKTQLEIYHQGRRRRLFVGTLTHDLKSDCFRLEYDMGYLNAKSAISLGPELSLARQTHLSASGQLFPSFLDRIPSKRNPAYPDYCAQQGINEDETNWIVLLTTIGRRGPSTFIFEPVFEVTENIGELVKKFRKDLNLTRWELAQIFEISELMLLRIEKGRTQDPNITRLLQIYLNFPEVAQWLLNMTGKKIHSDTRIKLENHFDAIMSR